MTAQYGEMNASFIRVLNLQRMLYENETGYIDALEHAWTSSIALSGFLLEGGLMAPDSMELDMPTERDGTDGINGSDFQNVRQILQISNRSIDLEDAARSAGKDPHLTS